MPIERHFLGWESPLERAVGWLFDHHATPYACDLSGLLIVMPARRAGRRLLEMLAAASKGRTLTPPRIVTPSSLPEHLYVGPVPEPDVDFDIEANTSSHDVDAEPVVKPSAVAAPLVALLARVHALRKAPASDLTPIIPSPPEEADFSSWLSIATDFARLDDDLAAHWLTPFDVPLKLESSGRPLDERQVSRWAALIALQQQYEKELTGQGLISLSAARRRALKLNACRCDKHVVLAAAADLPPQLHAMLRGVAIAGAQVTALVHAPATEAAAFDELGGFLVHAWAERQIDLDKTPLLVVDRPRDQAQQIVRTLGEVTHASPTLSPDDVTVGLGDETIAPLIERTLELSGTPARHAAGRQVARSRAVMLLQAWAAFVHTRKLSDLAALIRHPDAEAFLNHTFQNSPDAQAEPAALPRWTALLDRYITDHLHGPKAPDFVSSPQTKSLRFAAQALLDLADGADDERPLVKWAPLLANAMTALYVATPLSTTAPDKSELVRALLAIGSALRQISAVPESYRFAPQVTLKQAVALVTSQLTMALPPITLGPAVELLGWLELSLDDAPVLVITGLNEGQIPQSVTADPLLPDSIRSALGLLDNHRRYARDLLSLTAILRSGRNVTLIAGRRSADGDPIAPSRLLLACPTKTLIERVSQFYGSGHEPAHAATPLITGKIATPSRFVIPFPIAPDIPITSLNVTAFADYIRCPYRFYLKHIRKLETLDDRAVELDSRAYGSLVHRVLQSFAKSPVALSANAKNIGDFFVDQLAEEARSKLGNKRQPAVTLQLQQLEHRLRLLAQWQAEQAANGWRILADMTEKKLIDQLDLGDGLFGVEGRIDRIDRHEELGIRVIDYKTSDSKQPDKPEDKHRAGPKDARQWVDLQLPLYHSLVRREVGSGPMIELAFVNLPTNSDAEPFAPAVWSDDELGEAHRAAIEVARAIRSGIFWPPSEPPNFPDDLAAICHDDSPDRAAVIAALQRRIAAGKGGLP